jgi:hypothetical protein
VGYDGSIQVQADGPGEVALVGTIDIEALRRARHDPRQNLMAHHTSGLYAPFYRAIEGCRLDWFLDKPMEEGREGLEMVQNTIDRYFEAGIYTRPGVKIPVHA